MLKSFFVLIFCLFLAGITSLGLCEQSIIKSQDESKIKQRRPEDVVKPKFYIDEKYKQLDGTRGFLKEPLDDEKQGAKGGKYREYQGGVIYWHPSTGAYEVHGAILVKYKELKADQGFLGYPTYDEKDADGGSYSVFENGAILWTPEYGAHEVHGDIFLKYKETNAYAGFLGYPTTDQLNTPDGIGKFNHFERGSIYWSQETGAYEIHGAIREKWASMGWEKSWLGYPISDEESIPGTNGRRSRFTGGRIDWFPGKGASAQAIESVFELTERSKRSKYLPKLSDVSMRSLKPRRQDAGDKRDTLDAAAAFFVTRLDWVYPGLDPDWTDWIADWIAKVQAAGLSLQPTLNTNMKDALGLLATRVGRVLDVHGLPITASHVTWPNSALGSVHRPEYREVWLSWAKYYVDLGLTVFQHDGVGIAGQVSTKKFWPESNQGTNHTAPGDFSRESVLKFHSYLMELGDTSWVENYGSNGLADFMLADSPFTVFMVSRSPDGNFGIGGNGLNGGGGKPRLYLLRNAISYGNFLDVLTWTSTADVEVTTFVHDGVETVSTYLNSVLQGIQDDAIVVKNFGGGNLGFPFQTHSRNHAGELAELIIFDTHLDDVDRKGIEAYLSEKYLGSAGPSVQPNRGDLAGYIKLWLRADDLNKTHSNGEAVATWPATVGVSATVPAGVVLPNANNRTAAAAPTLKKGSINGHSSVSFDGDNDFLSFEWFDIQKHLLQRVTDQNLLLASPCLKTAFTAFQKQAVRNFFVDVRAELDAYAGKHVVISSNNIPGWESPYDLFNFGISELDEFNTNPSFLCERFDEALNKGKAQIFTMPKIHRPNREILNLPKMDWDRDYPELRELTKKSIAGAYACGGHMMVPWDVYQPYGRPRYFGKPEDYAHLFGLIRTYAGYFDGYDNAYRTGHDLTDTRYDSLKPVSIESSSGKLCAMVRVRAGDPSAPAVIHLVEWSDTPKPVDIVISHGRFFGGEKHIVRMLTHSKNSSAGFSQTSTADSTTVHVPLVDTWALLLVFTPTTDSDGDGVADIDELGESGNPPDSDGDGVIDALDPL